MVRAPGGQLITRIKTEAAAGKLLADVVDHSDRGLMLGHRRTCSRTTRRPTPRTTPEDVQVSPQALAARPRSAGRSPTTPTLVKNPPKILDGPDQAGIRQQADRPGDRAVGRHDLDAHHVRAPGARRGLLEEAGRDPAGAVSRPARRPRMRWCAARSRSAPLLYNIDLHRRSATARRSRSSSRPRACRSTRTPPACPRPPPNPNAAKLFLNWCLSEEGQAFMIKELGNLTSLKKAPHLSARLRSARSSRCGCRTSSSTSSCATPGSRSGTRPTATGSRGCSAHVGNSLDGRASCASSSSPAGRPSTTSASTSRPARSSCCSGPPAAARPRRCAASPDWSTDRRDASHRRRRGRRRPRDGVQVPPRLRNIGMVFQSYAVWPHMTVRQNVAYPLRHRRVPRAEIDRKVGEALELVGLSEYADAAGGGALRRADAARRAGAQPGLPAAAPAARRAAVATSTPSCGCGCATICAASSSRPASPRSTSRTTRPRRWCSATASASCATASCCRWPRADEIYNRPADLFVANFTGASNLLAGPGA